TLSGTPSNAGSYTITATATDGSGETADQTFSVSVRDVNHAPTLVGSLSERTGNEDAAVSVNLSGLFADQDVGDSLSLNVSAPAWLSYDAATGILSGTPRNADVGASTVTVTA